MQMYLVKGLFPTKNKGIVQKAYETFLLETIRHKLKNQALDKKLQKDKSGIPLSMYHFCLIPKGHSQPEKRYYSTKLTIVTIDSYKEVS